MNSVWPDRRGCRYSDTSTPRNYPVMAESSDRDICLTRWSEKPNEAVAKGYSSVGRASVSKTEGRGFESPCPCQPEDVFVSAMRLQMSYDFGLYAAASTLTTWIWRPDQLTDRNLT